MRLNQSSHVAVRRWLLSISLFVLLIVLVGGVTRLTRSGLSMVDWRPIMGIIPPIGEAEWTKVFEAYKQFPEYKHVNYNMNLAEFKGIFFWEYFHRILGRTVGLLFFVPWFYFILRRKIKGSLVFKTGFGFILGGMQGLMGWYMVKSGLVDMPQVSHFRLTAHLSLATIIIVYFYWLYLGLKNQDSPRASSIRIPTEVRWLSRGLLGLVFIQILWGGFVAGLKAGKVFNTFPSMHGSYFPAGAFTEVPKWINFFNNKGLVQFVHRNIAYLIILTAVLLFVTVSRKMGSCKMQKLTALILGSVVLQIVFGIATLLLFVPVSLASIHQVFGLILLLMVVNLNFRVSRAEF